MEATVVDKGRDGPLIKVVTGEMERRGWIQGTFWGLNGKALVNMLDVGLCRELGRNCQISVLGN